jgi:predicted DNA binding CopG/RHH family protein
VASYQGAAAEQINMRVPKPLLAAVKARAKARGIPYTRFIRERSKGLWPHRSNPAEYVLNYH